MLAHTFAMSESSLLRQLKRLTGLTPRKYLLEMRLNEAHQLLEIRQFDAIEKVALAVGYTDIRSFSKNFKGRFAKLSSKFTTA
ncbi:MAG: helix-turn-helix domain-containing protein [Saprospiraceae bacterium]|nr:helix-turn-helix domain-containing protein [Saprospiraceae bacterium]MCF8249530.1 helix-turn-helix domain-containing protein [Saprospiraceae bacterium]MCF8281280.1 helix-turn-helix domain-containing protein [Bacteroidales bacterium]MCF8310748.1 helix-turn-helix domain-containing protein [Saprospiraceae bacterium]MCF8439421.1 helix-turn-helix domain-containing protein [Saprospiraceae bacterium]